MKNVLLVTYHFYPEQTPRSFRIIELMKELSKFYNVTVLVPDRKIDYKSIFQIDNLSIIILKSGYIFNKNIGIKMQNTIDTQKFYIQKLYSLYNYLFNNRQIEYSLSIYKYLKKNQNEYDLVISNALPFCTHLGSYLGIKNNQKIKLILEYGDPFYFNKSHNLAFYFKHIEQKVLKRANYITVPIEEAKKSFKYYKIENKIKVIPQGFNFSEIKINHYEKNKIPTFMYAGIFYDEIRNPLSLFKELSKIDKEFKFIIYTNKNNYFRLKNINDLEKERKKLGNKLEIRDLISREKCIFKMSQMDFLINLENINIEQSPSKLIDYALSKRPILSFNQNNFNVDIFKEFLNGNYEKQKIINIEEYDIRNVTKKFMELIENE